MKIFSAKSAKLASSSIFKVVITFELFSVNGNTRITKSTVEAIVGRPQLERNFKMSRADRAERHLWFLEFLGALKYTHSANVFQYGLF